MLAKRVDDEACRVTGMSLGVNQLVTELKEGRDRVELLVSVGATRWEACGALVRQACVVANIPTINTLTVVGLVSIPGMMTGESPQAIAALTCPPSPSPPLPCFHPRDVKVSAVMVRRRNAVTA